MCLTKAPTGAVEFRYAPSWLGWERALPVSLSLPLRENAYRGEPVIAVLENLLPEAESLRRRVAAIVGAAGADAYSLLGAIGRDCVGALQFVPGDNAVPDHGADPSAVAGEALDDAAIEQLLNGLGQTPLGLARDDPFRVSVAGAQDKTALRWHEGRWHKPHGTTPTTHILKPQIGRLPNGLDLSDSGSDDRFESPALLTLSPWLSLENPRLGQARVIAAVCVRRFRRAVARQRYIQRAVSLR